MADDERLREALLELQLLREREARVLETSKRLVECLEAYSTAANPGDALASVFVSFAQKLGSSLSIMLSPMGEANVVLAASDNRLLDGVLALPFDPYRRPRNVSDMAVLEGLPEALDAYGAMIVLPIRDDLSLLTFRDRGQQFKKSDIDLVQRLSGLAAQALQASDLAARNDLLAAVISGSSSGFAISDAQSASRPLIYVNSAFEALSGYTADEVLGQNCRFLSAEAQDSPERSRLRRAVKDNVPGTFLLRNRRKSGEAFWNELTLFPVAGTDGKPQYLVATQTDVSERVQAAEDRDQVRGWIESALKATDDAFLVLDQNRHVALANGAVNDLFPNPTLKWEIGSAFDDNWAGYLHECRDLPGPTTSLLRSANILELTKVPHGFELDLPDGRSALVRASLLDVGGIVMSATDVTAMKSAQSLLTQRLSAIEAASNGIVTTDPTDRMTYLNSAASKLLGFARPEAGLGQKWKLRYLRESFEGQESTRNLQLQIKRGDDHPLETHEVSVTQLANGGSVIVIRDETERLARDAREDRLQEDLIRLQGQEAIAQLTAGIAHDFNNLLSVINGSATLVELQEDLPTDVRGHLQRILSAGSQSSKLISRLLDVGAGDDADEVFELASVLSDLPSLVSGSLAPGQSFEIIGSQGAMSLQGNANTLSQVLINLILNARDAMEKSAGVITLGLASSSGRTDQTPLSVGTLRPGMDYAVLSVTDRGAGIDKETAEAMFDPYFTTKGQRGTGLGLATAAMQLRAAGGAIAVETELGVGTTFTIFWPTATQPESDDLKALQAPVELRDMTILVVDDEPDVGAVVAAFLESRGAEVAHCQDPRDALEAIQEDPGAWSALVTDYDMPIMNGGALVTGVREVTSDLPIIVVTALAKRLNDPRLDEAGVRAIMSKPISLSGLSKELAELKTSN